MSDAMAVLHKLQTGLDVNVKFTGVRVFEYTPECIVFDLLDIPLYHGWLVDPQVTLIYKLYFFFVYNSSALIYSIQAEFALIYEVEAYTYATRTNSYIFITGDGSYKNNVFLVRTCQNVIPAKSSYGRLIAPYVYKSCPTPAKKKFLPR